MTLNPIALGCRFESQWGSKVKFSEKYVAIKTVTLRNVCHAKTEVTLLYIIVYSPEKQVNILLAFARWGLTWPKVSKVPGQAGRVNEIMFQQGSSKLWVGFAWGLDGGRSNSCQRKNDRVLTSTDPGKMLRVLRLTVSVGRTLVLTVRATLLYM